MQSLFNSLHLCLIYVLVTASNLEILKLIMLLGLQPMDFQMPVNVKYQIYILEMQFVLMHSCISHYSEFKQTSPKSRKGGGKKGESPGRHWVLAIALFSFMFKALFSKNIAPFSSVSESESGAGISVSGTGSISPFLLSDLRGGNLMATFRGTGHFCPLWSILLSALVSFSSESDSNFY